MRGKYSAESLLKEIIKLEPLEFIGICKIVGVDIYKTEVKMEKQNVECADAIGHAHAEIIPREFEDIWSDLCDKVAGFNRVKRRNLGTIIYSATKKEK